MRLPPASPSPDLHHLAVPLVRPAPHTSAPCAALAAALTRASRPVPHESDPNAVQGQPATHRNAGRAGSGHSCDTRSDPALSPLDAGGHISRRCSQPALSLAQRSRYGVEFLGPHGDALLTGTPLPVGGEKPLPNRNVPFALILIDAHHQPLAGVLVVPIARHECLALSELLLIAPAVIWL